MKTCSNCGWQNRDENTYCEKCGEPLAAAQEQQPQKKPLPLNGWLSTVLSLAGVAASWYLSMLVGICLGGFGLVDCFNSPHTTAQKALTILLAVINGIMCIWALI